MGKDARLDAIDIWLFRGTPLEEEVISAVYDGFFMTELPTNENSLWKLYAKASTMKWFRNGRLATKKEVEIGLSDMTGEPLFEGLQYDIYTWIVMCTGKNANKHDYKEFMQRVVELSKRAEEFTERVAELKKFKGIKYSDFEPDEKTCDVDIVTVMNEIINRYDKRLHGDNEDYRKAVSCSLRYCKYGFNTKDMMTNEKVICRKVYEEMLADTRHAQPKKDREESLKEDCNTICKARGKELDKNDFVYKIIDTMKKQGYTRCSVKQRNIIDEALAKIIEKNSKNEDAGKEETKVEQLIEEVTSKEVEDMLSIDLNDIFK